MTTHWKLSIAGLIILIGLVMYWTNPHFFSFFTCDNLQFSLHGQSGAKTAECYRKLGRQNQNISFCEKVPSASNPTTWDMKYSCILGVAEAKQDPTICDNLKNEQRDVCLLRVNDLKKDPSICELMNLHKNECYSAVGISLNAPSLCGKIQQSLDYRNQCYFWVAKNTSDVKICDNIVNNPETGDYRGYCQNEIQKD